jgi:archaellum component FlaC
MSTIYGHGTQKTRKILDSERTNFHRRVQDGEDAFKKEINALVDLPEWSTTNKRKGKVLTKEDIAAYTRELQDWFKDLEIHKRLLMEGEPEEGEMTEEREEGEVNDTDEESVELRISELLQTGKLTWKKLTEGLEAMQSRYDAIQTDIYFDIFTRIDDDSKAKLGQASANLESIEHEEIQDDELSAVSEKIATTGKNLERQSEGLARLITEAAELEKEIEAVRAQTTQASSVCQLVRTSVT